MTLALVLVAGVWVAGCVWSFTEQTSFARFKHFHLPQLLPLVIDGLAVSMAAVAYAASLDARPAVFARIGTAAAVALSAASNAAWAWERSSGDDGTIALAIVVPVLANLAFEVLLSEIRRQVMRRRGIPAPVKLPLPRLAQAVLAPWATFVEWRRLVLEVTSLRDAFGAAEVASKVDPDAPRSPDRGRSGARRTRGSVASKRTPGQAVRQTPRPKGVQTPLRQTPLTDRTPPPPDPGPDPRTGPGSGDTADLRRITAEFGDRTPSINEVQRLIGGGRARAVRLRGLADKAWADRPAPVIKPAVGQHHANGTPVPDLTTP